MKVLIIGIIGFIGRLLAEHAIKMGAEVYGACRRRMSLRRIADFSHATGIHLALLARALSHSTRLIQSPVGTTSRSKARPRTNTIARSK